MSTGWQKIVIFYFTLEEFVKKVLTKKKLDEISPIYTIIIP